MAEDPLSVLIDRVAEAVVRKIDEQQKIDAIARAVLDRLGVAGVTGNKQRSPRKSTNPSANSKPSLSTKSQSASVTRLKSATGSVNATQAKPRVNTKTTKPASRSSGATQSAKRRG